MSAVQVEMVLLVSVCFMKGRRKTLAVVLQALINVELTVELRNDTEITGTLTHADPELKYVCVL